MKSKNRKIILFIVIAVIAAAAIFGVAYKMGSSAKSAQNTSGVLLDENASEWDQELNNVSGTDQGIKIPGYGSLTVNAGEKKWAITLANPKDNNCYFKYSITIDDSETPIYESDYIEPGKAIREFEVSEPLEAGDYTIYLNIAAYSMDGNNTRLNGASVQADLHVVD